MFLHPALAWGTSLIAPPASQAMLAVDVWLPFQVTIVLSTIDMFLLACLPSGPETTRYTTPILVRTDSQSSIQRDVVVTQILAGQELDSGRDVPISIHFEDSIEISDPKRQPSSSVPLQLPVYPKDVDIEALVLEDEPLLGSEGSYSETPGPARIRRRSTSTQSNSSHNSSMIRSTESRSLHTTLLPNNDLGILPIDGESRSALFSLPLIYCYAMFFVKRLAFASMNFVYQYVSRKFQWPLRRTAKLPAFRAFGALVATCSLPVLSTYLLQRDITTPPPLDVNISIFSSILLGLGPLCFWLSSTDLSLTSCELFIRCAG